MKIEKTISAKIADIIGYFMSLEEVDKQLVFKVLKDIMEKE